MWTDLHRAVLLSGASIGAVDVGDELTVALAVLMPFQASAAGMQVNCRKKESQ